MKIIAWPRKLQLRGHRHSYGTLQVPRNPRFGPIPGDDAAILGKVVTVLRRT
jgi:SOS-response transcriptional repressor LexA